MGLRLQEYVDRKVNLLLQAMREAHERCEGRYEAGTMRDVNQNLFASGEQIKDFANLALKVGANVQPILDEIKRLEEPYIQISVHGGQR